MLRFDGGWKNLIITGQCLDPKSFRLFSVEMIKVCRFSAKDLGITFSLLAGQEQL